MYTGVIAPSRDDDSIADQCSGREREAHLFTQRGMVEVFTILSGFTHRIPTHLISDFELSAMRAASTIV